MRVIAGEFRSRHLRTPPGLATRPTPDRLRETLFSILQPRLSGAVFLDAYAGSGAVGIEALSRGAARAIFVEKDRDALLALRANLEALALQDRSEVIARRAADVLPLHAADIVFLDPPYELVKEYTAALAAVAVRPPPLLVVQHASQNDLGDAVGTLRKTRLLRQGQNSLTFFTLP